MSFERRTPLVLVCCGSLNPVTIGHLKMFEIARSFLERMGTHIVIGGVLSPVHDGYKKPGLLPAKHRIEMCKLAVQRYSWLSVDTWEADQDDYVETINVLQHQVEKIKETYGLSNFPQRCGSRSPYSPTQVAVTLQPGSDLIFHYPVSYPIRSSAGGHGSVLSSSSFPLERKQSFYDRHAQLELNEASEPSLPDKTGIVLDKLGQNLRRMCCARPTAFDAHKSDMIYGAACDLRRTKIMLLCGGDLLESFAIPGLWKEEHIKKIVSDYGIVCIPRHNTDGNESLSPDTNNDRADRMRKALDRLHNITQNVSGTIILVNDTKHPDIAHISSTKCRKAIMTGSSDASSLVIPSVLNYIKQNNLYMVKAAA
uniref:nicotinamide/nicotinic acid mononucleotide adenylyltransferase 1-like n=1 Tax=Styela clava TaxID=7725 RepID=UPI00193976A7|nr:nicotinamide/nicotinic acid mononucleotide adenylyltransferase 1-like [Styela clava]